MKVYGTRICIDCRNYLALQKSRGFAATFIEITEDTAKLKEFLACGTTTRSLPPYGSRAASGCPFL